MEFPFNVDAVISERITRLDAGSLGRIASRLSSGFSSPKTLQQLEVIVDKMGVASAKAQGLKSPITAFSRLRLAPDQRVYLLKEPSPHAEGRSIVVGFIKSGIKRLFLMDNGGVLHEVEPVCILDFYVHESQQRKGFGKVLFEEVLKSENLKPFEVAIDRPSTKFLGFLQKHYNLSGFCKQANNFVVFDKFFASCCHVDYGKGLKRSSISSTHTLAKSPLTQGCLYTTLSPHQHKRLRNPLPSQSPPNASSQLNNSMEESALHSILGGKSNIASSTVTTGAGSIADELTNIPSESSNHSTGPDNINNVQSGSEIFRNTSDSYGVRGNVRVSQSTEDLEAGLPCGRAAATYLTFRDKTRHRQAHRKEAHMRNPLQWMNCSDGNSTSSAQFSRYGDRQEVGSSNQRPPNEYVCSGNVLGASFPHSRKQLSSVANQTRDKWKSYIF